VATEANGAAPTATQSPEPSETNPTATPLAGPTTAPASTPISDAISVPDDFLTHADDVFGIEVRYPPEWESVPQVGPPSSIALLGPDGGEPFVGISLFYNTNLLTPADAVDLLVVGLFDRTGFRTLEEEEVTLLDGRKGFQSGYQWRDESGEGRGLVFATVERARNYVVFAEGPKEAFDNNLDDIRSIISSLQITDPEPLGIPRDEALTLYETEPLILDPAIAQESGSIQYIVQIFSGLVSFDQSLQLQPDLAESWERSEDGLVYTFTLRDNAVFHDGKKVTAEDVKASWTRAASLAGISSTVGTYLNDIIGVAEVMAGDAEEISGLEVLAEKTLQVTIDAPKAYFLSKLAHPVAFIVDQAQIDAAPAEGDPWWVTPNGTGPFSLREWMAQKLIVLEANDLYYGTVPTVPNVVFHLHGGIPSLMYEAGDIDAAIVIPDELERIQDASNPLSKELIEIADLSIRYVGLNADRPPFDDPLVRRAFLLATDRKTLVESVFGGGVELAQGFVPPGLPGFTSDLEDIPFDPDEAKRLLAASTYGESGLPDMFFVAPGTSQPSQDISTLVNMWRQNLGVDVEIQLIDPELYYYVLDRVPEGSFFTYGWIADYPDPHNFLDVLFRGGATNNVGRYLNAEVDALLDQAGVEGDIEEREKIYQQVERMLVGDAAAIPLYFDRSQQLVKPYVDGLSFTPFGMLDLRNVVLQER
jgi:ABC-type transport system substrate-binding protein